MNYFLFEPIICDDKLNHKQRVLHSSHKNAIAHTNRAMTLIEVDIYIGSRPAAQISQ
jgi:hypothetical protein